MTDQRRILIVEDNDLARKVNRVALADAGFLVEEAGDGATALKAMARTAVDLVLLDIRLPDMSGFDVADAIRARPGGETIPIIVCSALPQHGDHARGVRARVADYLFKPVSPSQVVTTVRSYLTDKRSSTETAGPRYRVLIVDDEPAQRKLTSVLLAAEGYEIVTAADGREALEVARRFVPDAIVSDVLMPHMDGFRLCGEVRRDPALAGVPVILCSSAYTEPSDIELAHRVGANALVDRSADQRQVLAALDSALITGSTPAHGIEVVSNVEPYLERVSWQLDRQLEANGRLLQRLAVREAELAILAQAAQNVERGDDTNAALDELLQACLNAAGLSRGAIHLAEPDGTLTLRASLGYAPAQRALVAQFFGKLALLKSVASVDDALLVPGPSVFRADGEQLLRMAGLRGLLLAPVRGRGESHGVLWMGSERHEIDEEWRGFARAVANQVGHAVLLARAVSAMAEAEERYRSMFETAGEGLFQISNDGRLTMANPALARSFGYASPTGLLARGGSFKALFADPGQFADLLDAARKGTASSELEARRVDGGSVWLQLTLAAATAATGGARLFDGVAFDTTDRRRAERLSSIEQMQRMQMQMKDQFLSQVSHELRTPLAAMHQYVTIVLDGLAGDVAPKQREYLETVLRNALQLGTMIDDLLAVSRAETKLAIVPDVVDLAGLLSSTIETFSAMAREKAIRLSCDSAAHLPLVFADSARLNQVLTNLVANALKFTPAGGNVAVRAAAALDDRDRVLVSVADSGVGIPESELGHVFDYLYQGHQADLVGRRGFGIGLYICRDLVTRQGGRIWVESTEGKGTTFLFTVPVAPAQREAVA